ncbi:MAG: alpha-amylase family glycosyl hydrolase [Hydrogenophilus sp.]|nr:alpha-amylase family glycosyl hydrolase [Hydrogenophilus sp.]
MNASQPSPYPPVLYTIWPRSFADGNADGIGDLLGIIEHLDDLCWLGIDILWLTPIHPSSNADFGYDILDYCAVAPELGTLNDLDQLVREVHARGMRLLLDLVVNHTSHRHPWFERSRRAHSSASPLLSSAPPDHPFPSGHPRAWYHWHSNPPPFPAIFGGNAWSWDEIAQSHYLHLFLPEQPDLNWENPAIRQALAEIAQFWLDRGIDGFRIDALTLLKKHPSLLSPNPFPSLAAPPSVSSPTDVPSPLTPSPLTDSSPPPLDPPWDQLLAQPGLEDLLLDFLNRMGRSANCLLFGEANGLTPDRARAWLDPAGPLRIIPLHFEHWHIAIPDAAGHPHIDPRAFSDATLTWYRAARAVGGYPAIWLENHDTPRLVTRFSPPDPLRQRQVAKALAAALALQPAYILLYQGQELGLPNAQLRSLAEIHDGAARSTIAALRARGATDAEILGHFSRFGRDAVRKPIPWDAARPHAGFTAAEQPWTPLDPAHLSLAWRQQRDDPDSILHHYRRLLHRRRVPPPVLSPPPDASLSALHSA